LLASKSFRSAKKSLLCVKMTDLAVAVKRSFVMCR
jgi:hypothetical protein